MTPEKQRIEIAKACGFSGEFGLRWILEVGMEGEDKYAFAATKNHLDEEVPDYLNDLNAMHEAEMAAFGNNWDEEPWAIYKQNLYGVIEMHRHVLNATAAQRAEAFLKTIGKWEEST